MTTGKRVFPRQAKGKRPVFFDDPAIDQLMTFFLGLAGEVSVLRERMGTIEALLDEKGTISREDIEAFVPDEDLENSRAAERAAYIERVFRMHDKT
jgi:hypothetical protein